MQHATFSNQILREGETATKLGGKIRQQPLEVKIMAHNLMKPDYETIFLKPLILTANESKKSYRTPYID